jgi:hypothetical protein
VSIPLDFQFNSQQPSGILIIDLAQNVFRQSQSINAPAPGGVGAQVRRYGPRYQRTCSADGLSNIPASNASAQRVHFSRNGRYFKAISIAVVAAERKQVLQCSYKEATKLVSTSNLKCIDVDCFPLREKFARDLPLLAAA